MNNYGLHSLRSGGASAAYKGGVPNRQRSMVDGSQKIRQTDTFVKI